MGGEKFTFSLRLTKYDGAFSYDLVGYEKRGMEFLYGGGIGLDFKYFFFGASASLIDEIKPPPTQEQINGEEGVDAYVEPLTGIPLPKINLGFRIPTPLGIWIDGVLGLEPTPMVRMSLRYNF